MNYYEYTFTHVSPVEKGIVNDILAAELGEIGFESFMETETGWVGYIPEKNHDEEMLKQKLSTFPLEGTEFFFTQDYIKGKNWNERWGKNYFRPVIVGNECIIHASFHQVEPAAFKYDIVIDPKMAFGTGNHETTRLITTEMLKLDLRGKKVLDMGCGTAVLAILAAKKGAGKVVAIDIDEWAYENALDNVRLNHTEEIQVVWGGAEKIGEAGPFDFIFANINRNILLEDIKRYARSMETEALLFMSGFYTEDIPAIEEECKRNKLTLLSFSEENNWAVVKSRYFST